MRTSKPTGAPRTYRKTVRLPVGRSSVRIRVFMLVFALLLGGAGIRAIQLQGLDSQAFAAEAAAKMQSKRELPATRGEIVDRNGVVLASTEPAMLVSIDPDMVRTNGADKRYAMSRRKQEEAAAAPAAVAEILAKHLGGRKEKYLEIIDTPDSRYEVVARRVPAATFTAIEADMRAGMDGEGKRRWYGVFGAPDPIRVYPNRSVASNVVGFVNAEGDGAAGLEYALDAQLEGTPGEQVYDASTYGRIPLGTNIMTPPVDGATYELTLDSDLQWMVEQALADGMREAKAKTGTAVVMNIHTGEILALANGPSFDAANPGAADSKDLGNRAVTEVYEPGSVQKVLTMAALADQGLVTPDTKRVVPGSIASGGGVVRDSFAHGDLNLTARGIVAQSSNVGMIMLTRDLEKQTLTDYLSSFGLGAKPGTGLPGESTGQIPTKDMPDYTRDQVSFGQGLSVNAVQMAAAVASVTNGGTYHQPVILKSAKASDGTPIELPQPTSRRVVSEEASAAVVEMMESVITLNDNRKIPGYRTAGKSGTAQRFDPQCKCYNGFTASFVNVAPAEDPQLLVYVVLDRPSNGNLGSRLALPVTNNILSLALPRYNVAPSTTEAPNLPTTFD
ncbi:cell division protein FtsI [Tessaracoccus lubricantis]|uniref:Cell division protein FtsI n=2 Tax=Tessaracoccus lubricantis TaxID=545543 RepID=A0ABP9FI39_9ACTN